MRDMPNPIRFQVSHNASGDGWFIVSPLPSETKQSMADTPITNEMAVNNLLRGGRTVYEFKFTGRPWLGRSVRYRWRRRRVGNKRLWAKSA